MADKEENLIDKVKNFSQTKQGRIVSIATAIGILAIILIIILTSILKGGNSQSTVKAIDNSQPKKVVAKSNNIAAKTETSSTSDINDGINNEDLNSNFEVYQTRDPFKPAIKEATATVTATPPPGLPPAVNTSGTVNSTTTPAPAKKSLLLKNIVNRDGINFAVINYDGTDYELKTGDQVGSSPYQVQQIGSDNVTLLYGDDQFTLNVGQEVYK